MLNAIIRFSLRNRSLILAASVVLLVWGGYLTTQLPIDVFPDLDRPRVTVMTEAHGLSAEEVERILTSPLETSLLGATGVQDVRSQSVAGLSVIYVEFGWEAKILQARQVVQERLTAAQSEIPAEFRPQMGPITSLMGQIMNIGLEERAGPRGGVLSQPGANHLVAELIHTSEQGRVRVYLWDARERRQRERWTPVAADGGSLEVQWSSGNGKAAVRRSLALRPVAGEQGAFEGSEPALVAGGSSPGAREVEEFLSSEKKILFSLRNVRQELTVASPQDRQMALRSTADWVLRPRLRRISGVAQVTAMGGGRRQYQVLVDPRALLVHGVTLDEVEKALHESNPAASGGFTEESGREYPIVIDARLGPDAERTLKQLREVPVRSDPPRPVLLHQVARIVEAPQTKRGDAGVNGRAGVILTINRQPHADTRELTAKVVEALRESEATLPLDAQINAELFQMKGFIDRGIHNVGEALLIGAGLVVLILFLFLLNFRTTFISLTAIPLSLVVTTLVFRLVSWLTGTELSINVMTLGGIAVAMGELVDDAVVDVENIFRRLRENNASPNPHPALEVIFEASKEVRNAIVFGTLMVILVFLPLFALSGVEGRLFAPLGLAYIVSILASLLVSLTVTPVLSYYLLPRSKAAQRREDSPLLRVLKAGASGLVRFSMRHAGMLLIGTWLLVAGSVFVLTRLGSEFLPEFDEGSVQVNVSLPGGSSLAASNETCRLVDVRLQTMRKTPENPDGPILHFMRRTGRAELDEHVEPVSNTEYILSMNPDLGRSRDEIIEELRKTLQAEVPGASVETEQPLAHLISHMLSGVQAQIAIKIHGDDLDTLRKTAEKVRAALHDVDGLTPPVIEAQEMIDEVQVRLRSDDLAAWGLRRGPVASTLQTALQGEVVSQVLEGQRRIDLLVRLDEPFRSDVASIKALRLKVPEQQRYVSLADVADIGYGAGPTMVGRENARRRIALRCNAEGRDLGSVVADAKQRVAERVELPEGYSIEYGGQFESQQRATLLITVLGLVSLAGMFFVLYLLFPSARVILQILNALPAAFIGGVLALALTGQTMSVASMVGFISLGGIAARNGILLVTHYVHLMKYEGEGFTQKMILRGSLERLSPVLMTALTAGIALVPLVLGGHQPGREVLYPVATVILGGLVTSTLCEFLLHPGLFWQFSGKDAESLVHPAEE